jgi:D-glycero-alpha-D-manno-heptose-7-phosphate kinase
MPEFYRRHGGAVVSFAINKYIYVMVNKKFSGGIRVSYSITENVGEPDQLKHDIVREALKEFKTNGIEVVSVADITGQGSGLGSSSSFAVGLTLALRRYNDLSLNYHPSTFAETAYHIERNLCGHPVGKQDHYAAAYGGLNFFQFNKDETVTVQPIRMKKDVRDLMQSRMLLFWLGTTRHADRILVEQAKGLSDGSTEDAAMKIRDGAISMFVELSDKNIKFIGHYLNHNWQLKKKLALGISNKEIDNYYDKALEAGAIGGKLCGAGGSGFLLFYAEHKYHNDIEKALGLRRVSFQICDEGSQVIYEDNKND